MIAETVLAVAPYAGVAGPLATAAYYAGRHHPVKPVKIPKPEHATEAEILKAGWKLLETINHDIHRMYHPVGCHCALCEIVGDDKPYTPPVAERCAEPCFGCSVITCVKHPDHGPVDVEVVDELFTIHYYDGHEWREKEMAADDIIKINDVKITAVCKSCEKRTPHMWVDVLNQTDVFCDDCWNGSASRRNPPSPVPANERALIDHNDAIPDDVKQVLLRQRTQVKNLEAQLMMMVDEHQKLAAECDALKKSKGIRSAGLHNNGVPLYHLDPIYQHGESQPVRFAKGARDHDNHPDKCEKCGNQAIGLYKGKVLCRQHAIDAATDWGERQLGTFFRKCDDCVDEKAFKIVRIEGDELALCKECYAAYEGLLEEAE